MSWLYKILQNWEAYYYSEPFQIICLTMALITGLMFTKKELVTIVFLIYTLTGLVSIIYLCCITEILNYEPSRRSVAISLITLFVSYIEMIAFFFFFYKILLIKAYKIFIVVSFVIFTLLNIVILSQYLFFEIPIDLLRKSTNLLIPFQLLPLLFLCFAYYYQILNFSSGEHLFKRPSFWIITSLFFYVLFLTPFILIYEELRANHKSLMKIFFSIHYFSFGIIFIALTNAFLCKKTITT
jgi:hypothetical protein